VTSLPTRKEKKRKVESEKTISKEKKAEEKNLLLSSIVENSDDAIIGKSLDGTITSWNNGAERIYGYNSAEVIGKSIQILAPPSGRKEITGILKRIRAGEQIQHYQTKRLRKDGTEIDVSLTISPIRNKEGKIFGASTIARDITERKKAEDLLRKSEVKFRTVADFTYDWEYWIAPDGYMIYVSPSCKRVTGYDVNEFIKDPKLLTRIVHPEDKAIVGPHFDLISSEELHAIDFRIITRDGKTRWISHSCKAVFDDNGKWIGRRANNRDITERKKMEQALSVSLEESKRSASEISALLNSSKAVLQNQEFPDSARAIFDSAKELIGATAGYVALLSDNGRENEVLFLDSGGLPCTVDPSLPMPIRGLRAEAYNSGKVAVENNFNKNKWMKLMPDGHVQLENVLFAPLMIQQRPVGVIGLANKPSGFVKRDAEMAMAFGEIASVALANSKMLEMLEENEKELRKHSEHLEELVEERTKQLKDSERMATIGQTAAMVGHDIRNPLQAITGDVYLAKTELASIPESEEKKSALESLQEIEKNIDYINKIVADLQDFARPLNPHAEEADLKLIIDELLKKNGLPENVKVSVKVETEAKKVMADCTFINRIMYNLVNNAVQAMPNGGGLTIRIYKEANDTVISVKDTGAGIPESVKGKLFTPMFTTKAKGQGFGLVVIKRMTEALGGTVTFESQEGKGTTFKVRLPPSQKR